MTTVTTLRSNLDASVNFVRPAGGGFFESRYVRRPRTDYLIAYLSSQSGCRLACRFCHLTRTRQTSFDQAGFDDLVAQIEPVIAHHAATGEPAARMNVNFMARGEPLLNPTVTGRSREMLARFSEMAAAAGVPETVINLSSIMPREVSGLDLVEAFPGRGFRIFWSLYSVRPGFRKRWLPLAADPEETAARLADWQRRTGGEVVIHHALIAGENCSDADAEMNADLARRHGLKARMNLVRYNSADAGTGEEASDDRYDRALAAFERAAEIPGSRIVPRVGRDVFASCGTFVTAADV